MTYSLSELSTLEFEINAEQNPDFKVQVKPLSLDDLHTLAVDYPFIIFHTFDEEAGTTELAIFIPHRDIDDELLKYTSTLIHQYLNNPEDVRILLLRHVSSLKGIIKTRNVMGGELGHLDFSDGKSINYLPTSELN